jgi:uncharacterized protein (DUF433 family)
MVPGAAHDCVVTPKDKMVCWSVPKDEKIVKHSDKMRTIGRYVVADPKVCHGRPTFRGTRVLVADVLDQVAAGMAWETIVEEWNGNVSKEAIGEAVQLAGQALERHVDEFIAEPARA